ncbi:MAG TPA: helix-turn-helix transcriptional regulator [Bacteroidales bacterium]|jgi:transcriptional regulator with XRE-family HTH domain|nr:helix-turn-helix transcriptional regulator [Bacteroidales bacterium]MBK7731567.1 helix-turn-helix transcriptional regulator [Bacteroidales bacterium]MBP8710110.1 helix-turn-helix transcriptional regulator [Bacteroidales bacterium]HOC49258.1 helix-turn-helix transcriptional regulator [Bacteroidales bacterium]HOT18315.1 helix-turn-helix transcriptional regulator [Bacteroidales bacterium]
MKDRIQAFLQTENKSYAQFADEIGVQPSGISHILSGRNNPSLDFVIKMLHRYPSLSTEWLLFGRGSMYKKASQPTLFDVDFQKDESSEEELFDEHIITDNGNIADLHAGRKDIAELFPAEGDKAADRDKPADSNEPEVGTRKLSGIVFFYSDKTFTEYKPS